MALAGMNESPFESLNPPEVSSRIQNIALGPKQKRNATPTRPAQRLPHGRIVVASAQDNLRTTGSQCGAHSASKQHVESSHPAAVGLQHLIRKPDFIAVDLPLPQAGIG